jgi:hypothetical protein
MYEVKSQDKVIARLIKSGDMCKEGLNFFSSPEDYLQVGSWQYGSGTILKAHNHNKISREIQRTQELLFVRSGLLEAEIYNEEDKLIEILTLEQGDILVVLGGGHGYRILNENTSVLEIKNGPYLGAEVDRRRL